MVSFRSFFQVYYFNAVKLRHNEEVIRLYFIEIIAVNNSTGISFFSYLISFNNQLGFIGLHILLSPISQASYRYTQQFGAFPSSVLQKFLILLL